MGTSFSRESCGGYREYLRQRSLSPLKRHLRSLHLPFKQAGWLAARLAPVLGLFELVELADMSMLTYAVACVLSNKLRQLAWQVFQGGQRSLAILFW